MYAFNRLATSEKQIQSKALLKQRSQRFPLYEFTG